MELTRRDALAVLAGAGILGGAGTAARTRESIGGRDDHEVPTERLVDGLVATASVVYPAEVENAGEFVETYARSKLGHRPEFRNGLAEALADLEAHTRISFDDGFTDLDSGDRDLVLRRTGVDTADPDPDGTAAERIRYYLVNEVLYALYASPAGGELVGIENPQGHPGGTDSYQRGPSG